MAFSAFGTKPLGTTGNPLFGQQAGAAAPQAQTALFGTPATNVNTNVPKPPSLFGIPPSQPTQGTSLFGQSVQQPAQGTSLFSQQQQGQGQGNSLFGNTQPAQQSAGTSLFGQQAGGMQQQGQQNTLFGGTSTQGQPGQPTSLFGTTQTGQQANIGTSLFGVQPGGGIQQPSLFGATTTQTQPNSLFGGAAQPAQTSLFGTTTTQPQQQQSNIFGGGQSLFASTAPGLQKQQTIGGYGLGTAPGMFGKQPSMQTGLQGSQSMQGPLFTRTTKFNDLTDDVKRLFEALDAHIQGRAQISNDIKQRKVGDEAAKGQELIRSVHKDLVNAINVVQTDVYRLRDVKTRVDQCVQDTIATTRIIDGFRNPQQNGQHLKTYAEFPLQFFQRVTDEMRERLRWYKATVEQIERKLASAMSQASYTPHAITSTLEAQHTTFIALAAKTAAVDAEVQKIKAVYTQMWRAKTGSMRDPFNELDRGSGNDFGLESIGGK